MASVRRLACLVSAAVLGAVALPAAPAGAAPKCPHPAEVARDVRYLKVPGSEASATSLDVYTPAQRGDCDPAPVVIWVHGGGWKVGDKRNAVTDKVRLFRKAGYVFVSVNYRLGGRYPMHNEDVAAAVAWVVERIGRYGGDPDRIALLGHSAGAQIVASVSTDERYLGAHDLALDAIRCAGPLDTQGFDVAVIAGTPGSGPLYRSVFGDDPEVWAEASPLTHVAAGKSIPDMLLVSRGLPVRRAAVDQFALALRKARVDVTVVDATGLTHADVNLLIGAPGDDVMTPAVTEFLEGCFASEDRR